MSDNNIIKQITVSGATYDIEPAGKVTSWQATPDDSHFPTEKLVKDECDNVREFAAGKCKANVAATTDTVDTSQYSNYLKYDGTEFSSASELSNYISGLTNCNTSKFILQDNYITTAGTYVLVDVPSMSGKHYVIKASELDNFFRTGDIVLLKTVDIPDRWYQDTDGSGNGYFYKMETSKVPLDDYVLKNPDITPGTKCKITYDKKGLVTAGADLEISDIPALDEYTIYEVTTTTASETVTLQSVLASLSEIDWGDGSKYTGLEDKSHTYAAAGSYIIKLYHAVIESGIIVDVTEETRAITVDSSLIYNLQNIPADVLYLDWGDGTSIITLEKSHTYVTAGSYTIVLKGVTSIGWLNSGEELPSGISQLKKVSLGNKLVRLDIFAFGNCTNLVEVNTDHAVNIFDILTYSFYGCSSLLTIAIPRRVTAIYDLVFTGCTSLLSVTLPNSLTTIGEGAFSLCPRLTNITIPDSVTTLSNNVFTICGLTALSLSRNLTAIPKGLCNQCDNLATLTIPEGITTIGETAFHDCTDLLAINLPNTLTTISARAFEGCKKVKKLIIPSSVTNIGGAALQIGNTTTGNKATFHFRSTVPPIITTSTFILSKVEKIYVPKGYKNVYLNASGWSSLSAEIKAKIDECEIVEGLNSSIDLTLKQDTLPTTTTAGKVLKSTSTAGSVEWDDMPSDYLPLSGGTMTGSILSSSADNDLGGIDNQWGDIYLKEDGAIYFYPEATKTGDVYATHIEASSGLLLQNGRLVGGPRGDFDRISMFAINNADDRPKFGHIDLSVSPEVEIEEDIAFLSDIPSTTDFVKKDGSVSMTGSLLTTSTSNDLGSVTNKWGSLYLNNQLYLGDENTVLFNNGYASIGQLNDSTSPTKISQLRIGCELDRPSFFHNGVTDSVALMGDVNTKVSKVSSTDNAIVRFDGTAGAIQNSSVTIDDSGNITATSFKKSSGTASQFLKADGTVDSTTYAADSAVVHLAGAETVTGAKIFSAANLFTNETKFTNTNNDYCPTWTDIGSGIGKSSCFTRGAFMQAITGQILLPNAACTDATRGYNTEVNTLKFQRITGTSSGQPSLAELAKLNTSGLHLNTNINLYLGNDAAHIRYNSTDNSIEFVF